jgi:hypothetical protein
MSGDMAKYAGSRLQVREKNFYRGAHGEKQIKEKPGGFFPQISQISAD